MPKVPHTIAVFGNCFQIEKSGHALAILQLLKERGLVVKVERQFAQFLSHYTVGTFSESDFTLFDAPDCNADIAISMGGDGTFLNTAGLLRRNSIPILGINTGRLGFLADATIDNAEEILQKLVAGNYNIEERSLIEVVEADLENDIYPFALNEVAVLKHDNSSLIEIETKVNGVLLTNYWADGLIVCTPTGSTGYSLSVGGPVLDPGSASFCLSPVAPHSLTVRPVVLRDDVTLELHVKSRSGHFLLSIDGRSKSLPHGRKLILHKADYTLPVVKIPPLDFFCTLREKMLWGKDCRR